jgi:hypothetical protein
VRELKTSHVECGYCDVRINDTLEAFTEHDAACESNPLAARVRGLESKLARLSPSAELQTENAELTKRVAELEEQLQILGVQERLARESNGYLQDVARAAKDDLRDLQSQLAWTPVEKGLPTESGVYEFLLNANCVTVDSVDIWRLDTELQSCTEWYWKDHDWFESPLKVGGYRWFRRITLPEAT